MGALRLALVPALISALAAALAPPSHAGGRLGVVTTLTDLGSLAREIGGDQVSVTVLAQGPQDPHFIEPRPSFIRLLHDADLFAQVGMDLEIGWIPTLLRGARNPRIQPGGAAFLDASTAIDPLEVPAGTLDRSAGDVHPYGNPHYLTDPLNGLRVARRLRDALGALRPEAKPGLDARYRVFAARLAEGLAGAALAERLEPERLAELVERGRLDAWLREHGEEDRLGGWLAAARPLSGQRAVEDHRMWAYFARRFGLVLVATLEPRPGIAPTTRQLGEVVERVRADGVALILSSPYFDTRHARWVAERTGARVARMAHQPGARPGTDDYLATVAYNVREVLRALGERGAGG